MLEHANKPYPTHTASNERPLNARPARSHEEDAEQTALRARLSPTGSYQFKDFFTLLKPDFNPRGGDLGRWLKALEAEGTLVRTGDLFRATAALPEVEGNVEWHPKGHALLRLDDTTTLFLPRTEAGKVLNGERVRVRRIPAEWRGGEAVGDDEGLVMAVLSTAPCYTVGENMGSDRPEWIGAVRVCEPMITGVVRLSDRHLTKMSAEDAAVIATPGTLMAGQLRRSGTFDRRFPLKAWFDVRRVIGRWTDPGIESRLALEWMQADDRFTGATLAEAHRVAERPMADVAAEAGRRDLRHLPLVTVDGPSTKDFDDAIGAQQLPNGDLRVTVAIADVSAYVMPNGPLDRTAQRRTTTVYLPHRTVPMLPEVLSTGVCSLNPGVDRPAMVCEATIAADGSAHDVTFFPAMIRSQGRLMYHEVDQFIRHQGIVVDKLGPLPEGVDDALAWSPSVQASVTLALKAAEALRSFRNPQPFDRRPEILPVLGENDKAVRLRLSDDATPANKLVEEFMLLANREAARFLVEQGVTAALFRNQQAPEAGQDRLKTAEYATVNAGHYSLGDEFYTHFTSPIRRYPDLMAHRAIKRALGMTTDPLPEPEEAQKLGEHCTEQQKMAKGAGYKAKQWLIVDYAGRILNEPEPAEVLRSLDRGWVVRGTVTNLEGYMVKPLDPQEAERVEQEGLWMKVDRIDIHGEKAFLKYVSGPTQDLTVDTNTAPARSKPAFGGRRG